MQLGVVFPQLDIGPDPGAIRAYVAAAEALGYRHLLAFDHVIGANAASRPDWKGAYQLNDLFHEPFVLFGFLAGICKLELFTGVIILPQRQTVLLAKQAAEIDVLAEGRFRLGLGLGWNEVEYEALGESFANRGIRSEEQIALLRELFTKPAVTFRGRWHQVSDAGINPLPRQRPIPLWLGGRDERQLRRVARLADGWLVPPFIKPERDAADYLARLRGYMAEAGRDPKSLQIEAWIGLRDRTPEQWADAARRWRALGATHLSIDTMRSNLPNLDAHIAGIRRFKETIDRL
ncbi:MAG: LLM class F420-dependent oxidoreductase [Alphaproteobacteria bacterium]|nr:LLM class F420-dependent oxidoreductase [Alphaproteobacteria bacterium]